MEELDNKINAWLRDRLIPRLAEVFEEKITSPEDVECRISRPKGSFYLSALFFCGIRFSRDTKKARRVLVKLPAQDPVVSSCQNYEQLFANEILFYREMQATNGQTFQYPECYLAGPDDTFANVIVLQDVRDAGYFDCVKKVDLSQDYVVAALQAIAKFHANFYTMKEKNPEKFQELLKKIINVRYKENSNCETFEKTVKLRMSRVSRALRERDFDAGFVKKVTDMFDNCYARVMMKCARPVEPLATITHGDCTINNVLFRKTKTGELEAMLIDFALMMYSSPAMDIATFVYLSCSREDVRDRIEDFLRAYHDTLSQCLKSNGIWDPKKYSFEAFWKEYRERAIFGCVAATFFVPMMTEYEKDNDVLQLDHDKIDEINLSGGGEAVTNKLVDMLLDLRDNGLLNDYIECTQ